MRSALEHERIADIAEGLRDRRGRLRPRVECRCKRGEVVIVYIAVVVHVCARVPDRVVARIREPSRVRAVHVRVVVHVAAAR